MCFSAEGSFVAGTALLVAGAVSVRSGWARPGWLPLAVLPVGFGLQQLAEGAVWLALERHDAAAVDASALAFLFFSHGFWLVWVPLSAAWAETDRARRVAFGALVAVGAALALLLFGSILGRGFTVEVVRHSIHYGLSPVTDGIVPRWLLEGAYAVVIVAPLLGSSHARVRAFGAGIAASAAVSLAVFLYAFASVWCFFSAALSAMIPWVLGEPDQGAGRDSSAGSAW